MDSIVDLEPLDVHLRFCFGQYFIRLRAQADEFHILGRISNVRAPLFAFQVLPIFRPTVSSRNARATVYYWIADNR